MTDPSPAARIVVLFHAGDRDTPLDSYLVDHYARYWREAGHDVTYLFGVERFVPADLCVVHVNLSVVPDEYLAFAARYPASVNGSVKDIRKSAISDGLVVPGDGWQGPVIVKSDLNYGGEPERILGQSGLQRRSRVWRVATRTAARARRRHPAFRDWRDYRIFDSAAEVPGAWWRRPDVVVERFRPEREGGLYHLRMYMFLGDAWRCLRITGTDPVLKAETSTEVVDIEPDPAVYEWRARFALDYGKLDYVVSDGEPVLIDVNKTTGATRYLDDAALDEMRRRQASGLYALLPPVTDALRT